MNFNIGDPIYLINSAGDIIGSGYIKNYNQYSFRYIIRDLILSSEYPYNVYSNTDYPSYKLIPNKRLKRILTIRNVMML